MQMGKKILYTVQNMWGQFMYYLCTPLASFRRSGKIKIKYVSCDGEVAYIALPAEPLTNGDAKEKTYKTVRLRDLMDHKGVDLYMDFDKNNCLIGIEILA